MKSSEQVLEKMFGRMASKSILAESYKDPRWNKISSEIRATFGNACQLCKQCDRKTHVHHWWYSESGLAYDVEPGQLVLLCESCHAEMHRFLHGFRCTIFPMLSPWLFRLLNAALEAGCKSHGADSFIVAIVALAYHPGTIEYLIKEELHRSPDAESYQARFK